MSGLVEREIELARLERVLKRGVNGAGGAALIEGPAGIGKTALLGAARRLAPSLGLRVLASRGGELQRDATFAVVRELFAPALAPGSEWSREQAFADAAKLAMPALGFSRPESSDSPDGRFAAVYGLYWLAINLARDAPLLLVVDDVHAIDEDSLTWLAYLVRNLDGTRLALLLAARSISAGALEQSLVEDASVERLEPGPLSPAAVAKLTTAALGAPDPVFTQAIYEATSGLPFLVTATLATLADRHVPPVAASCERVRELAARGVAQDLLARLRRTATGAIEIAQVGAILGSGAELGRVAALAGKAPAEVVAVVDALASVGLTGDGWPLRFSHPLIEEALVEAMSPGVRAELHGRAAALITAEGGAIEEAAAHMLVTEPAGDQAIARSLLEAGRRALREGATLTAAAYLRRALREPPSPDDLAAILLELGRAERQADDASALDHLAQAAELAADPAQRARTLWELSQALGWSGALPDVLPVARRALDSVPQGMDELRLEIGAEMLAVGQMDLLSAEEVDALAAELPEADALTQRLRPGERWTVAERRMLGALSFAEFRRVAPASRVIELARLALSGEIPEREALGTASFFLPQFALIRADEHVLPRAVTERLAGWAREHGAPGLFAYQTFTLAELAMAAGDLAGVEEARKLAMESATAGASAPLVAASLLLLGIAADLERGRVAEARATIDVTGIAVAPIEQLPFASPLFARGCVLRAEGALRPALDDVLASGDVLVRNGNLNPAAVPWRSVAALLHAELGERERALEIAEENLSLARRFGARTPLGAALRTHGAILGGDGGLAELHESVSTLAQSPARLEHAKALVELGAALRRDGQRRAARESLRAGHELAGRCGADPVTIRAEDELRASGARLVSRPVTGIAALTPSELRVATLAAAGATNPQIAQALFVSLKTVEMHLRRAYRKLDISSRAELPAALKAGTEPALAH